MAKQDDDTAQLPGTLPLMVSRKRCEHRDDLTPLYDDEPFVCDACEALEAADLLVVSELHDRIRARWELHAAGEPDLWPLVVAVHAVTHYEHSLQVTARCADGWDYVFHMDRDSDEVERSICYVAP